MLEIQARCASEVHSFELTQDTYSMPTLGTMSLPKPLQLHHIGYVVQHIESAVSDYVARFTYQIVTPVIHDPYQTALVQFLRLDGDRCYLEFVSPDGPQSKLSGALKRKSALNHLCYTCASLESAIEHLEEHGMRLISALDPGTAFNGRRICWLLGEDNVPIELVERTADDDLCVPALP